MKRKPPKNQRAYSTPSGKKARLVEVTDPREAERLIYGGAGLEFPHVSVAGDGRVWADAKQLAKWRASQTTSMGEQ